MGIQKEIWLAEIKEKFVPDGSFLKEFRDMSAFVQNKMFHLAEAGVLPDVIKNSTGDIPYQANRSDTDLAKALDTYSTKVSKVRNTDEVERSYNLMQSIVAGHKTALQTELYKTAAFHIAPGVHVSGFAPKIATSGANNNGVKRFSYRDILNARAEFNRKNIPQTGRVIILSPDHEADLIAENQLQYQTFMGSGSIFGFKTYLYSGTPHYKKADGAKLALGGTITSDYLPASVFFQKDEVYRALGAFQMFATRQSPVIQGDAINFLVRASVGDIRGKGIGAIYSKAHS